MTSKLLVKNIPAEFSDQEIREFLGLFGGQDIVHFSNSGKMKNCCFVMFVNHVTAKQALETLHQFELCGKRLVVEYAKPIYEKVANQLQSKSELTNVFKSDNSVKKDTEKIPNEKEKQEVTLPGIAPGLNVNHNFPSHLIYKYPDPTITILTNIANALATVPKFYMQVLHLMNKMNLPPPFSGPTVTPPLPGDSIILHDASVDTGDLQDFISSDESELESDSESTNKKHKIYQGAQLISEPVQKRKRLKVLAKAEQEKFNMIKSKPSETSIESAFELGSATKRFEFKLAASIQEAVDRKNKPPINYSIFDERGEFGKIEPKQKDSLSSESEEEEEDDESAEYISLTLLNDNRISSEDILSMAQFKKYSQGNVTNRLYIKNLAKQVVEDDLKYIFKRFIRTCSAEEILSFEIRLMQEGRMKGQAFVTFPSEVLAEKALTATHGYILHAKPMVIQFARSAKQKE